MLSETKDDEVYDVLCALINDDYYLNKRGTFVHCLRNYAPERSFSLAIDLLMEGGFEVAHEAFEIINSIEREISGEEVKANFKKLMDFYQKKLEIEVWRDELIEIVLDKFN